jgi:hypothetical protein
MVSGVITIIATLGSTYYCSANLSTFPYGLGVGVIRHKGR